jgi:hypothetical protein
MREPTRLRGSEIQIDRLTRPVMRMRKGLFYVNHFIYRLGIPSKHFGISCGLDFIDWGLAWNYTKKNHLAVVGFE